MSRIGRAAVLAGSVWLLSVASDLVFPPIQAAEPAPLFASDEALELTLTLPLHELVSHARRRPEIEGTLSYENADGNAVDLDVEVTTRGKSRLEYCRFPPIGLNLKRGQVKDTLFAEQNKLKLVTRCRDDDSFEDYLELEYVLYRFYEHVNDYAFRVRPLRMRYVDSERDEIEEAPAFFLEHKDGLAARVGMHAVDVPRLTTADLRPDVLATVTLFEFMIGNTDWSALAPSGDEDDCCHNGAVLETQDGSEEFVFVPYDFDQAGLIDAVYALPSEKLRIRSVRQRLYRGFCATNAYLDEAIGVFDAARPAAEALIQDARLRDRTREEALEYLAESYEIINDPQRRQSMIVDQSRGESEP